MDLLPARVSVHRTSRINIRNSVKARVGHWFSNLWEDMRRKSPVAVQNWVDSLPTQIVHTSDTDAIAETSHEACINNLRDNQNLNQDLSDGDDTTKTGFIHMQRKQCDGDISECNNCTLVQSTPVRIPRRGTIVREASLPSDSPQRRRLLLRDSSFHSDDAISHCSSVDSLLESRRPDPEAVLLGLGFGPSQSQTDLSRIPQRFLGPSKVLGVDTEKFLKQRQLQREMHESGVWGYRGLTGDPHSPPSHIVAKIMECIHNKDQQNQQFSDSCLRDTDR